MTTKLRKSDYCGRNGIGLFYIYTSYIYILYIYMFNQKRIYVDCGYSNILAIRDLRLDLRVQVELEFFTFYIGYFC